MKYRSPSITFDSKDMADNFTHDPLQGETSGEEWKGSSGFESSPGEWRLGYRGSHRLENLSKSCHEARISI